MMTDAEILARGARLEAFVTALDDKAVSWGIDDCSAWPAQWIADMTGKELDWPEYRSEEDARQLIERFGGLEKVWEHVLTPLGIFAQFDTPEIGNVGVVDTSDFGPVGGIFADGGVFLWRHKRGVTALSPRRHTIIKVWQV